jgi:5-methylcytosine-specific restriction endonuclease McrA
VKLSTRTVRGKVVTLPAGAQLRKRRRGNAFEPTRMRIAERDGWRCGLCGERIDPTLRKPHPRALAIHHEEAFARGGSDEDRNLHAAHAECNLKAGAG